MINSHLSIVFGRPADQTAQRAGHRHVCEPLGVSVAFKQDRALSRHLLKRTGAHATALRWTYK